MARSGQTMLAGQTRPLGDRQQDLSVADVAASAHEKTALELRTAGATFAQIATQLHHPDGSEFSVTGAYECVRRALSRARALTKAMAEEERELDSRRLDAMLFGIWDQARSGGLQSIDRALRILDHRAKLLGLYAVKKESWEGKLNISDRQALENEVIELAEELVLTDPELMAEVLKRVGGRVNLG